MSKTTIVLILVLSALCDFGGCYESCSSWESDNYTGVTSNYREWNCEDGYYCCGGFGPEECCSEYTEEYTEDLSTGAIVGIFIGGIAFLAIVVVVAVFAAKMCTRPRVTVQPTVATVATVSGGVPGTYPQVVQVVE